MRGGRRRTPPGRVVTIGFGPAPSGVRHRHDLLRDLLRVAAHRGCSAPDGCDARRRGRDLLHFVLDFAHDLVGAGEAKVLDGAASYLRRCAIEQSEVEMRLRVVRPQLDRAQQELLRLVELSLLEQNQAEVGVQDEDVRILAAPGADR